jgi:subtilisin-like proprotein convertase family protein
MLQARDSIIAAVNAGSGTPAEKAADVADIWAGFAVRGMGVYASIEDAGTGANNTRVTENFNVPGQSLPSFTINDVNVTEGNSGTTTATFTVSLANPNFGASRVTYSTLDSTANGSLTFTSATPVTIPSAGPASSYPLNVLVSGLTGSVQKVTVRLNSLTHEFPEDLDVLLVSPTGQKVVLMSDAGNNNAVSNINVLFSDGAPLMSGSMLTSGTYAPTDLDLGPIDIYPAPAPAPPYSTTLSAFNGASPNGTWSLYILDDEVTGQGSLQSFSLLITTEVSDYLPAAGELVFPVGMTTQNVTVTVFGDSVPEPSETFFVNLSNGVNATIADTQGVGTILSEEPASGAPLSFDDAYSTSPNTPLVIPAPGVLANDVNTGGGAMTAAVFSVPTAGTVTLSADGGFTYVPPASFTGSVSFTYRAANAIGAGNVATVTITVGAGTGPIAVNDTYSTPYVTTLTVPAPGVLANDNPNGGGTMTAVLVSTTPNGALSFNSDGSFTYTPNVDFVGSDIFTYRASNTGGLGNTATVTISVLDPTTPQPPRALTVTSVVGNQVTIRWTKAPIGPAATNFFLEGGLFPGQTLAGLPTGSTYPIFTFIAPTGSFYIRLHQISGAQRSSASNEVRLHVNVPVTPSAPSGLVAVTKGGTVDLAWRNTFGGGPPDSLIVSGSGPISGSLPIPLTDHLTLSGILPAGTYSLTMRASNAGGVSPPSNAVSVTVPTSCLGPPQSPANFLLYKAGGIAAAVWDPADTGPAPTGYVLNVVGPFTGGIPTTARSVSGAPPAGTYTVSVTATNACGSSAPTATQTMVFP